MSAARFRPVEVKHLRYTPDEFRRIQGGFAPRDTDDKWALLWRDGALDIARAWTGEVVLRCRFAPGEHGVHLTRVEVSDAGQARHEVGDVAAAWFLIGWRILGTLSWEDVEKLGSRPSSEDAAGLFSDWARLMRSRVGTKAKPKFAEPPVDPWDQLTYFLGLQRRHPDSLGVAWRLASLYLKLARREEAEAALERLSREPLSPCAIWAAAEQAALRLDGGPLARALGRSSRPEEVEDILREVESRLREQAVKGLPGHPPERALGVLVREERTLVQEALRESAGRTPGPLAEGLLHLCAGAPAKAAASFELALRAAADDQRALVLRALARFLSGAREEARRDAEVAKRMLVSRPVSDSELRALIDPICDYIMGRSRADAANPSLMAAIRKADLAAVQAALDAGADADFIEREGHVSASALHLACERKAAAIARLLMERGADLNSGFCDDMVYGETIRSSCLDAATPDRPEDMEPSLEVLAALLDRGADPQYLRDWLRQNEAAWWHPQIAEFLRRRGSQGRGRRN